MIAFTCRKKGLHTQENNGKICEWNIKSVADKIKLIYVLQCFVANIKCIFYRNDAKKLQGINNSSFPSQVSCEGPYINRSNIHSNEAALKNV